MNIDIQFYIKLFARRLPIMAACVIIGSTLGVISAMKLPETWSSSARLLVEEQQIPDNMVRSTVQTDTIEQLDIIQQRLLTRANLIDIANKHSVFADINTMEPDTIVSQMRRATSIRRTTGRNRATLLTISFEARTGQIAANVVNEFVTIVLEENSSFRRSRAENTLDFFSEEVDRLARELDTQSLAISRFKSENVNALPENQGYRLGRQNLLQERLERLERERSIIEAQRQDLIRIYETTGRTTSKNGRIQRSPEEVRLAEAQGALNQALNTYSDTHPNVVRLKNTIERLETQVAGQISERDASENASVTDDPELQTALSEFDTRLRFIGTDIGSITIELEELAEAITLSAANGIALTDLERDYKIIEGRYGAAVANLNSARMSERIESTAQGQRVTVIENANVPRIPTGPNRPKVAVAGTAAGLGLAGAYFVLLELLNRRIRRPAEMISHFNITPISTIPYMESRRRKFLRRAVIIGATVFVIVTIPMGLWYIDTNYLPLEIVVQKGLDRLGLI
ncbi:MAG: chain length-determining protein [Tateyamaria sp.]|uniref:GumC family protein n=1 Tax=Tateyamaria sp. TaxID=1929288 RepID=UPI00329D746D